MQGEKGKGDLAAGGKPTGSSPQAGHGACHLVVKITAASQVGQVPSFPQLDLTLGAMMLTSGLQVSLFPPPSPTPSSSDPQIPPSVLEKGMWGCHRPSLQRWLGVVLTALLTLVLSPSAPSVPLLL